MKNPILVPELRELLKRKRYAVLQSFLMEGHAREIAEYLTMLDPAEIWKILSLVDKSRMVEIFSYLDMDVQVEMASGSTRRSVTQVLMEMSPDDRADLFQHLDPEIAGRLLVLLPVSERADIIKLTSYSEETAGAIMTTDFITLNEKDTVEKAIRKIRREAPSKETVYYVYVTDDARRLIGFVSLRRIILSKPAQKIGEIMKRDVIYARVGDDQESVARLIDEYDLIALPVVDAGERLTGIITYDDAIDIIREEQTEDLEKLMAISGGVEDKTYLDLPAYVHFRKRVFWVVILGIFGLVTGLIIEYFQKTLETLIILAFYMPLLNAAGGNTGSQSATVVMRSLTLKELTPRDIMKVARKELIVSSLLSLCLAAVTFGRVILLSHKEAIPADFTLATIAVVIAVSLGLQVIWATVFGALIPIIATRAKIDPAVVSSPLLATLVDMGGIVIYFSVAKIILGI